MKKITCTFILLLISIIAVQAQSNFKPGYIITNKNDTINGWIDYRTDAQNGMVCKFKVTKNDSVQEFLPGSIYGYRLIQEGKYYISKSIVLNDVPRVVFLDFLVQGMINLYHYTDNPYRLYMGDEYYFFEDETGKITTITKRADKIIRDDKGRIIQKEDNRYKGIVRYLFQNAEPVMKETEQLAFTQESMIEITKAYHDQVCTTGEPCIIFKSTPDKHFTLFRFSVFGGIQFNQLHDAAFNYKISPLIGGRMNISVPRFNKYLSIQLDLSVFKVSGQSVTAGPSYSDSDYLYTDLNYLCVPIQIACKYTYGKYQLRPSIALGQTFLLNFDYKEVQHHRDGYNYVEIDSPFIPDKQIYAAVGLDYVLKNGQAIFINAEARSLFSMRNISIKLGYIF